MDIAEIRKKAKAQGKTGSLSSGSAEPSKSEQNHAERGIASAAGPDAGRVDATRSPASRELDAPVVDEGADGLDRLFSAIDVTDFSFADVPEQQEEFRQQSSRQYLAFNLGNEEYALDITRINEIIKVREFTDVPRTPEYILGIISLRGVVVPVYDLRLRLNLGKSELTSASRVVVCVSDDVIVGLLVDCINQVVNFVDEDTEPPPGVLSGLDREMVTGVGRFQGRMIILLNLQSVLDVELS